MGYQLGKDFLSKKGKTEIEVKLIVPSRLLAMLYKEKFRKKMLEADSRVKIEWDDLDSFKEVLTIHPVHY